MAAHQAQAEWMKITADTEARIEGAGYRSVMLRRANFASPEKVILLQVFPEIGHIARFLWEIAQRKAPMHSSWHEGWLALAVVLALGCGRQAEPLSPSRAGTPRAASAAGPTGASLQAIQADAESSPRSVEAQDISSQVTLCR